MKYCIFSCLVLKSVIFCLLMVIVFMIWKLVRNCLVMVV